MTFCPDAVNPSATTAVSLPLNRIPSNMSATHVCVVRSLSRGSVSNRAPKLG